MALEWKASTDEALRGALTAFGLKLKAAQWHQSSTYESTEADRIEAAVAGAKNEIGEALLEALAAVGVVIPEAEDAG